MSVFPTDNSTTAGPYVLGIDYGTESCRAGIFDLNGSPIQFAATPYKTTHPRPGWAEQSPQDWWDALVASVNKVLATSGVSAKDIKGISYDATTMTVVAMDKNGNELRNSIMWMDVRATKQTTRAVGTDSVAKKYVGEGSMPHTAEWYPFKAAWLKENEPETYNKAYRLIDAPDWVTYKLTGEWALNINTAAHRMYYNRDHGGWPTDFYEEIGCGDVFDKLPETVNDLGTVVGGLSPHVAEELGLLAGTPVAQGGGDAWHGQIGLNVLSPGKMTLVTGSSHVMCGQSDQPISGKGFFGGYTDGVLPGQYTVETGLVSSGSVLKWFKDNFCSDINEAAEKLGLSPYDILNSKAREIPLGSEGLIINETFQGSRTPYSDGKARGLISGLSLGHTRVHMYKAIQEAVCYGVELNMRTLREADFEVKEFVASGGALKGRDWIQMHADVTGVPITLTEVGDAVTLGSCILAATGAGLYDSVTEAADAMVHERGRIEPDMDKHEQYSFYVDRYAEQFPAVQEIMHSVVDHVG